MGWIAGVGRELAGLFVDDGRFALAIVVWVLIMAGVARYGGGAYGGAVLFLGLAAILVWTCLSATSAHVRRQKPRRNSG